MADISTRMSVEGLSQYKSAFSQAQNAVKTLDAELKKSEAQFKATGNQEQFLADKGKILQQQLKLQKQAAEQAKAALKQMDAQGVNPMSRSYQEFAQKLANAETAIINTTSALNTLGQSEDAAATGADKLTTSVNGINKKISLDQVIGGIDKITGGLENAAKKAIEFGKQLWDTIMNSASQADDISTMATRLGLTDDQVQRMMYVADRFEAPVEAMAKTWKKLKNNMASDNAEIVAGFEKLGVATHVMITGKYENYAGPARDYLDVFWEVGDALMRMTDESEREQMAQKLLGRSWDEMIPLFKAGREAYEDALKAAPTASEDAVESAASLNDRVKELEKSWDTLKLDVIGEVAPALEKGADAIATLLDKITEYLKTDAGQQMLEDLGTAVSGLFEDLGKIDPEKVVSGFVGVFNTITDGLKWLLENKSALGDVLVGIVTAWAGARLTGGALQVLQLVNGVKDLTGGGGGGDGTTATTGGGNTTGGGGFWTNAINTAALVGSAASFYRATEGNMKQQLKNFYEQTQGMSVEEQAKLMWMQTTGMSEAEYNYRMNSDGGGEFFGTPENPVEVTVTPVAEEGSAQSVSDQVGTVDINGIVHITGVDGEIMGVSGNWWGGDGSIVRPHRVGSHANGLPWVPYDGYLSVLHKGERVVPAREVSGSRTFSSNLYVESMYMNNGQDADGLAARVAAENQRIMSGFGS